MARRPPPPAAAGGPFRDPLLVFTNESHGLIWRRFAPVPGEARVALAYGSWFAVHTIYSYSIVLVGSALLFARFAASPLTRPAVVLALLGPIGVLLSNLVHVLQPLRLPIDPTPTALAVALALLVWAITRHQMFTLVPVARGVPRPLQAGQRRARPPRRRPGAGDPGRELLRLCRPEDLAARYGGEELCVLLPQTDLAGATAAAQRLWSALRGLTHVDETGVPFQVTASLGVAQVEAADATPRDLVTRAPRG